MIDIYQDKLKELMEIEQSSSTVNVGEGDGDKIRESLTEEVSFDRFLELHNELEDNEKKKQSLKSNRIKTFFTKLSDLFHHFQSKDNDSIVLKNQLDYRKKHLASSQLSVDQWMYFYEHLNKEEDYDYELFFKLLSHHGVPDFANPYLKQDKRHHNFSSILLFKQINPLIQFYLTSRPRQYEIVNNYYSYLSQLNVKRELNALLEEQKLRDKEREDLNIALEHLVAHSLDKEFIEQNQEEIYQIIDDYQELEDTIARSTDREENIENRRKAEELLKKLFQILGEDKKFANNINEFTDAYLDYKNKHEARYLENLTRIEQLQEKIQSGQSNYDYREDYLNFRQVIDSSNAIFLVLCKGDLLSSKILAQADLDNIRLAFYLGLLFFEPNMSQYVIHKPIDESFAELKSLLFSGEMIKLLDLDLVQEIMKDKDLFFKEPEIYNYLLLSGTYNSYMNRIEARML